MVRQLITLSLLITAFQAFSLKRSDVPPGTVQIEENFFFDQTEISNISWLEYLFWNKNKYGTDSEQYRAALPDTNVWGSITPFVKHYFRHPSYRNYPVVGISYDQAVAFCQWRSERVNEMIYIRDNKLTYDRNAEFEDVPQIWQYRLPTAEEWEEIALAGDSKRVQRKRKSAGNLSREKRDEKNVEMTAPVMSYWPNIHGAYNLIGNVAEMVSEKGVSKGGSWKHSLKQSFASQELRYDKPVNWLGFRCVCERK